MERHVGMTRLPAAGTVGSCEEGSQTAADLDDLQALLAFGDADHHLLAGGQRFHAVAAQHRGMDEDIACRRPRA